MYSRMGVILHPVGGSVYSRMGVFKEISPRRDTAIFSEELKMVPPRKPLVLGTWFLYHFMLFEMLFNITERFFRNILCCSIYRLFLL